MSEGTYTTVSSGPASSFDFASIERAIAAVGPEPIGEWMRKQGFPPEKSLLLLPKQMDAPGSFWPRYVKFSAQISEPYLCLDLIGDVVRIRIKSTGASS